MNLTSKAKLAESTEEQILKKSLFSVINETKQEEFEYGRWTEEEHQMFLNLIVATGTLNWKKV
jgi:hypothetical protein